MRRFVGGAALVVCVVSAWAPAGASAQPGSGPRQDIDQTFTTTQPNAPTGFGWTGRYHAAGNPKGEPPYMRRMVFYAPKGLRYDTSVPDQCTASDTELEIGGLDACPPESWLGGGTTEGIFYQPIGHAFVIDHFKHHIDVVNNANEQIILVKSEGSTVIRGRMGPGGSTIDFRPTTCFPRPPSGQCADDYILQLGSTTMLRPFTKTVNGRRASYATTPPKCPKGGYWRSTVKFWWADGNTDSVVSKQPCARPRAKS